VFTPFAALAAKRMLPLYERADEKKKRGYHQI
jgi:hypothetical protein